MSRFKSRPLQLSDVDNEIINRLSNLLKDLPKSPSTYGLLHSFLTKRTDQILQIWGKVNEVSIIHGFFFFLSKLKLTNV